MASICRVGDIGIGDCDCHSSKKTDKAGVIITGSPNVFAEGQAVARVGDLIVCSPHSDDHEPVSVIASGSPNVFANDQQVARIGDTFVGNCWVGTLMTGAAKEIAN